MTNSADNINECESVSIRVSPGNYFQFPVVNNLGLFRHFYKTNENFNYELQCFHAEQNAYALYGKKGDFAYLICAWNEKEEINDTALKAIKSSDKFSYLLN